MTDEAKPTAKPTDTKPADTKPADTKPSAAQADHDGPKARKRKVGRDGGTIPCRTCNGTGLVEVPGMKEPQRCPDCLGCGHELVAAA